VALALLVWLGCGPVTLGADKPAAIVLEQKGYLVPVRQVAVSPKIPGQVIELRIEEGQKVKAGEVLARLDPAEQEAAFRVAQAELKLAETVLARAKEGKAKGEVLIAEAKVEVAKARLVVARHRLDSTVVRAPFSGVILTKRAEVGTLVHPTAAQLPASLCEMADLQALEVDLLVGERDLGKVKVGQKCVVRLEAFPRASYKGRVARVLPVADRARAAVPMRVRVEVPQGDDRLRPELSAIVQIQSGE
jgi:RND family efflux transporter MFP subunit